MDQISKMSKIGIKDAEMGLEMTLHNRIRKLRNKEQLTQKQVAEYVGVDVSTYAHYEKGDRTPDASKLTKLAELFGLNDELLGTQLPKEYVVSYDSNDIAHFKETKEKCQWIKEDSVHNRFQYEYLKEAATPILEERSAALVLPDIDMSTLEPNQTVTKVKLDMLGEILLSKYFEKMDEYYSMGEYQTMVSKRKIEERAIGVLKSIVHDHPTMDCDIKDHDKEVSWDGYLRIFRDGNTESDKKNYDADIPVQIKGHIDIHNEYFDKARIMHSVNIDDLKVYFRGNGCIYFQIFMSEDGNDSVVFYNSLYPSKIKSYLDYAMTKENKNSVSIPFIVLKQDPYALELLCKQFDREMVYQGRGFGQIVEKSIQAKDLARVKDMGFTVVGARTPYEALKRIITGDIVIYGKYDENGISFPVAWGDKFTASIKHKINEAIYISNKKYYDDFQLEFYATAPGDKNYSEDIRKRIYVSPNLYLEFFKGGSNFNFELNTDLMQICWDAEFLLDFIRNTNIVIGEGKLLYQDINISSECYDKLTGLSEVGKTLRDIGCKIMIPFSELTISDKKQLDLLVNIKKGNSSFNTDEPLFSYDWQFRDKIFPFLVEKKKRVQLRAYMFSNTMKVSLGSPAEDRGEKVEYVPEDAYIVPNYYLLTPEQFANLYYIDYESMFDQVDRAVVNEKTMPVLNMVSLNLIAAYDIGGDERFLEVAKSILDKIATVFPNAVNAQINLLQIEKRFKGKLENKSAERLLSIKQLLKKDDSNQESEEVLAKVLDFCTAVLLDKVDEAPKAYGELTQEGRDMVDGMPIMKLYNEIRI